MLRPRASRLSAAIACAVLALTVVTAAATLNGVLPEGSHAGTRLKTVVQMQDLLPTILELADRAGAGGELPGVNLATSLRAGSSR